MSRRLKIMPAPKGHPNYATDEQLTGRPKKYTDEFIENEADELIKWLKNPNSIWFEDFANYRDYSPRLLSIWAKQNKSFSEAYERAKLWQKSLLIKGGLLNNYNSNFTKFVLINCSDMIDKQTVVQQTNPLDTELKSIDGNSKNIVNEQQQPIDT